MINANVEFNAQLSPGFYLGFAAAMHYMERVIRAHRSSDITFLEHYINQARTELESAHDLLPEAGRKEVAQILHSLGAAGDLPAPEMKMVRRGD